MEKERATKKISIVSLLIAVVGLTVAFAAMSRTLTINGTATMDTAKWDIYFDNLLPADPTSAVTGEAVVNTAPTITTGTDGAKTRIGDFAVTLTKPGDKVVYTFDVVNAGDINATLGTLTKNAADTNKSTPTCTGKASDSAKREADAQTVCSNLIYTLKYTDGGSDVQVNDALNMATVSNDVSTPTRRNMTLTIEYDTEATELPSDDVEITGLDITLVYNQAN